MFKPKTVKVKAWNVEDRLMKRLGSIDCAKSKLYKEGHILLQYTGMDDQAETEIFDGDILLFEHRKYMVEWNEDEHQWEWGVLGSSESKEKFTSAQALQSLRLCHSFESVSED